MRIHPYRIRMSLHVTTPLIQPPSLQRSSRRATWIKLDALQPPGSFKIRGIGLLCEERARQGATRFISSSGGNAGLAVAYAGQQLGIPVTVVVPETTTVRAKELLCQYGAEVRVHGPSWQEANEYALSLMTASDAFIHPFDNQIMWKGHATIIDEIAQAGVRPDAIVASVGGGGLFCGIIEGLRRNGWNDVAVVAVETEGAASFHAAIKAGKPVEIERITSIATSLGAKKVAQQAFDYTKEHDVRSVVVSDADAVRAALRFYNEHQIVVEPACGAALAIAYDEQHPALHDRKTVVCIACGGATTTVELMQNQLAAIADSKA